MKILIVDDEEDIRQIARFALSQVGSMNVLEAENGNEGLRIAAEENPDAILMDVLMPGLDGPATLVELRKNPETSQIPVIFLTAQASPAELNKLKDMGAAGVLNKPFDPITLAEEVEAVLKGD
ncbi:MAG TPA: response regulator [Acidobacteriota bacterium]|nr:response regulator [Acidobacteriota bacterium]